MVTDPFHVPLSASSLLLVLQEREDIRNKWNPAKNRRNYAFSAREESRRRAPGTDRSVLENPLGAVMPERAAAQDGRNARRCTGRTGGQVDGPRSQRPSLFQLGRPRDHVQMSKTMARSRGRVAARETHGPATARSLARRSRPAGRSSQSRSWATIAPFRELRVPRGGRPTPEKAGRTRHHLVGSRPTRFA